MASASDAPIAVVVAVSRSGLIQNAFTGDCLTLLPGWSIGSRDCSFSDRYQWWDAWDGGWTRQRFDGVCLYHATENSFVGATGCVWGWSAQMWDWVPVGWRTAPVPLGGSFHAEAEISRSRPSRRAWRPKSKARSGPAA
jgi:hypothetical protein